MRISPISLLNGSRKLCSKFATVPPNEKKNFKTFLEEVRENSNLHVKSSQLKKRAKFLRGRNTFPPQDCIRFLAVMYETYFKNEPIWDIRLLQYIEVFHATQRRRSFQFSIDSFHDASFWYKFMGEFSIDSATVTKIMHHPLYRLACEAPTAHYNDEKLAISILELLEEAQEWNESMRLEDGFAFESKEAMLLHHCHHASLKHSPLLYNGQVQSSLRLGKATPSPEHWVKAVHHKGGVDICLKNGTKMFAIVCDSGIVRTAYSAKDKGYKGLLQNNISS